MKRELSRRPAILIAVALMLGLVGLEQPILMAGVLPILWLADGPGWRGAVGFFFILGTALGVDWRPREIEGRPIEGEASVMEVPRVSKRGQACEIEIVGQRYTLFAPGEPVLAPGDLLRIRGEVVPLREHLRDSSSFRNVAGSIRVESGGLQILAQGPAVFRTGILWRGSFADFTESKLKPESASAVNALCFNIVSDLDRKTYENLQRTGTIHIVSASGLHVLIFAAGVSALIALLPIPREWRLLLIGGVLAMYAIGAGMRPPVVRAVAMAAVMGLASIFRREPDLLSALGITATGYLIYRPVAIYDIGFQFSFLTVAALGMFLQIPEDLPTAPFARLGRVLWEAGRASFVATLASAPLAAYYFGLVSLVAIPANVLIALALPAITLTAFIAQPLDAVWPALSTGMMVGLVEPLIGWILWVAESFGSLEFAAISTPDFSAWWMLPYFAALLLIWRPRARPA